MSEINEVRERLERACIAGMDAEYVDDVSVLLADHVRLQKHGEEYREKIRVMYREQYARGERIEQLEADHARLQAQAITILRIPAQPGLDPITVYIDSPEAGAAAVTIRCYSSAWAACAWTAYWGSMGTDAIQFIASINSDYMLGCMLWPAECAASKRDREYAGRVAQAVIDHCRALVTKGVQP